MESYVLLRLVLGDKRLKAPARRLIAAADEVGVSAVTFWEVATLIRHGRLRAPEPARGWRGAVLSLGIADVPIDGEIAWRAGAMDHAHGDPADRLIMATAMSRSARLVTADREILRHGDGCSSSTLAGARRRVDVEELREESRRSGVGSGTAPTSRPRGSRDPRSVCTPSRTPGRA